MVVHAIQEPFSEELAGLRPLRLIEPTYRCVLHHYDDDRGVAVRRYRDPKETARPLEWTEELPSFNESLPGDQLHIFG